MKYTRDLLLKIIGALDSSKSYGRPLFSFLLAFRSAASKTTPKLLQNKNNSRSHFQDRKQADDTSLRERPHACNFQLCFAVDTALKKKRSPRRPAQPCHYSCAPLEIKANSPAIKRSSFYPLKNVSLQLTRHSRPQRLPWHSRRTEVLPIANFATLYNTLCHPASHLYDPSTGYCRHCIRLEL